MRSGITKSGLANLVVLYIVWGTTYLGIRVAVRDGSGFPAFTMVTMRFLTAALILLAWAAARRHRLLLDRRSLAWIALTGIMFWGANGVLSWGEKRTDSGLAALLVTTSPIWVAVMEAILDGRPPSRFLAASLVVGFAGVGVLSAPILMKGIGGDIWSILAVAVAPVSWAAGSIIFQRKKPDASPLVASAYQHLAAAVGMIPVIFILGEPLPSPAMEAWAAWGWLVVMSSVIAFTSYLIVVRCLPLNVVMTYVYVNPIIAVIAGHLILGEPVTIWTGAGALLIIAGVWGIFHERFAPAAKNRFS